MIIAGYPGIGKTTLAAKGHRYLDLESRNFFIRGKRFDDWETVYVQVALDLYDQGYLVFTPCHPGIIDRIVTTTQPGVFAAIVPDISLKDAWIAKLKERYELQGTDACLRAYERARDHYTEDISSLISDTRFDTLVIRDMEYYHVLQMINEYISSKHQKKDKTTAAI